MEPMETFFMVVASGMLASISLSLGTLATQAKRIADALADKRRE